MHGHSPLPASTSQVLIIGGGFGGMAAARALRNAPVQVTLIDRRNHHLFQPLLYQVASAALSPGDIAEPIRAMLSHQANARVLLSEVVNIDLEDRRVDLADRSLRYDHLVVAAGATHSYFGHDEWAENAPGLKTLDDALEIRQQILLAFERAEWTSDSSERDMLLTFVVVGGGPTGVELAGALSEIARKTLSQDFRTIDPARARVILVEAGAGVLPGFPPPLAGKALAQLHQVGVETLLGRPVEGVDASGVVLAGGERIAARTVIWCAGVAGSALARTLGVELDRAGRVVVEANLTVPGHPEAAVIGDLASFSHQSGRPLPGVAQVAVQMGRCAAENIVADLAGRPRQPFHYRDYGSMATIGRSKAVAVIGGVKLGGYPAWLLWLSVHLMALVGFRNRMVVLVQWAWSYLTWQRNSRLIRGERTGHLPELTDRGGPEL